MQRGCGHDLVVSHRGLNSRIPALTWPHRTLMLDSEALLPAWQQTALVAVDCPWAPVIKGYGSQ